MTPDATTWAKANLEIYRNVAKSPRESGTRFQETAKWEAEINQAALASIDLLASLSEMRLQYGRLHDRLSDMIESGRVPETALPEDYCAIVNLLEACATADAGAEAAIAKQTAFSPELVATPTSLLAELKMAEDFMASFEGDELQEGIDEKLAAIRTAIAKAEGRPNG